MRILLISPNTEMLPDPVFPLGLAFATMSLLGGYVIAGAGYRTLFSIGAGMTMAGAALMGVFLKRRNGNHR